MTTVLNLVESGVSITDAELFIDKYASVPWALTGLVNALETKRALEKLKLADVLANVETLKNRKTFKLFEKWQNGLRAILTFDPETRPPMTLFELNRQRKGKLKKDVV